MSDYDEIERLRARLAAAERLLHECEAHEGAEGWSDYLRKDLDAFFADQPTAADKGADQPIYDEATIGARHGDQPSAADKGTDDGR